MEVAGFEKGGLDESYGICGSHCSRSRIGLTSDHSVSMRVNELYKNNIKECSTSQEKEKEFDITMYQYHVKCNNIESQRALEQSFQNMSIGLIGVVVGSIYFSPGGCFLIYNCAQKIWMGVQQFKEACRLSHTGLDDVTFVTDADSYQDNTKDDPPNLNGSMLKPWVPLDPMKPLDPSFHPFR